MVLTLARAAAHPLVSRKEQLYKQGPTLLDPPQIFPGLEDHVRSARTWWTESLGQPGTQPVSQLSSSFSFQRTPVDQVLLAVVQLAASDLRFVLKQTRQAGGGYQAQYDLNITSIEISITFSFDRKVFDRRGLTSLYYLRESLIFCDRSLGVVDDSGAGYGWTAGQTKPNVPLPDEASDVEQHDADAHPPWNISLGWSGPHVRKLYGLSRAITLQVIASHFWMSWHLLFMLHISRSSFNL